MLPAVGGKPVLVDFELQARSLQLENTVLEAAGAQLLGELVEDLDVVLDVARAMLWNDGNTSKDLALDDILCLCVAELSSRPGKLRQIRSDIDI